MNIIISIIFIAIIWAIPTLIVLAGIAKEEETNKTAYLVALVPVLNFIVAGLFLKLGLVKFKDVLFFIKHLN